MTTTHGKPGPAPVARDAVQRAILEAGKAGIAGDDLGERLRMTRLQVNEHIGQIRNLALMPIVSRRLGGKPARYWASAELMQESAAAPTLTQRIIDWLRSNPHGGNSLVVAESLRADGNQVASLLSVIAHRGLAVSRPDPKGKAVRRRHYHAKEHEALMVAPQPPSPAKRIAPKVRAEQKLQSLAPAGFATGEADYSRAKVTVCPSGRDHRFTATEVTPMFSALAQGRYLPADTWASRAGFGA